MAAPARTLSRALSLAFGPCRRPLAIHETLSSSRRAPITIINSIGRRHAHATALKASQDELVLTNSESGGARRRKISKFWLRDNCRCKQCANQDTMQRNFNSFEIPRDIDVQELIPGTDGIDIVWSDSHKSHYTWTWLDSTLKRINEGSDRSKGRRLWTGSIGMNPPEVEYDRVMDPSSEKGMAELTNYIHKYGFCFVSNSPKTPEGTKTLLESIGPIRNTHYGGFYDFTPDLVHADTAYTNLALAAHTDTTYFTEPAGLQALHMLSHTAPPGRSTADGGFGDFGDFGDLGGKSLLVDGFYAAHRLRVESPQHYDTLRTVKIPWHASGNKDVAVSPDRTYPVIEGSRRSLFKIRWNNDDRGVVPLSADVAAWYEAARAWDQVLRRETNEYWFQLEPGRILIFDNWRVLHGRSRFEGTRRMCGAYINRDDFVSRWKLSNFPREEVITANMQAR